MATEEPQATEQQIEERITRLVAYYEQQLRKEFTKKPRTLHQIEMDVEIIGNDIKETITKEIVEGTAPAYSGTRTKCACGCVARFSGRRHRRIIALHGHLLFQRAYYYCKKCRAGFCPVDQILDIGAAECSRVVQAHIARVSGYLPFKKAAQELADGRGLLVSPGTVQHYAKRVGSSIGKAWDTNQVQQLSGNMPELTTIPKRMYISMDGVKVHLDGGWSDAKLGVVYQRDATGKVNHSCFYGSFEKSKQFGHRMRVLANVNGALPCLDLQVVADGAEWIWIETRRWFPRCVETLDYYHLTDHIWDVAQMWHGKGSEKAQAWMSSQKGRLLDDQVSTVINDIASWRPRGNAKTEMRRSTLCYIEKNRDRIQYKTLRNDGYDIGSGIMEASCKSVVKSRLCGTGMRWGHDGASAILHLTTHRHSTGNNGYLPFTAN